MFRKHVRVWWSHASFRSTGMNISPSRPPVHGWGTMANHFMQFWPNVKQKSKREAKVMQVILGFWLWLFDRAYWRHVWVIRDWQFCCFLVVVYEVWCLVCLLLTELFTGACGWLQKGLIRLHMELKVLGLRNAVLFPKGPETRDSLLLPFPPLCKCWINKHDVKRSPAVSQNGKPCLRTRHVNALRNCVYSTKRKSSLTLWYK